MHTAAMKKTIPVLLTLFCSACPSPASDFAFKMYHQLRATEGNLFFSPASIEAALAMTREGAAGNTLRQMNLLLPAAVEFPQTGADVTLESANALWIDLQFPVLDPFKQKVQETCRAELRAADFKNQPNAEREAVNRWVEEKTRDKIKNLLPPGSVDALTRLILVNAVYFKGDWRFAFDPALTAEEPFRTAAGAVRARMMTMPVQRLAYLENETFQALDLPYKGDELSMLILLPRDPAGLNRIEDGLSVEALNQWTGALRNEEVVVHLPRFVIESQFDSLAGPLAALGITDAFNPQLANFTGISTEPLYISDAVHKAFVEVNEEGTEAAAATGIIMRTTSMPAPPKLFRADRPFLFMIRARSSGAILFMGRVCEPSAPEK